ncbi:MAG: DUF2911 domain-containing protein [Bacteroidetes bacterium]|nr:DUF2911 domain-containing protein [Bacteroidota bacterium]
MKHIVVLAGFLLSVALVRAQSTSGTSSLDNSPLDMSYYPVDYPVLKIQDKVNEPLIARVVYSRPQKRGRKLFGELVTYGQVWRLGANEATEVEFFKDVKVDGKNLKKGRYTLYALVDTDKWTLIFNKETDTWGAFKYSPSKDVLRSSVPVEKQTEVTEAFSIAFQKAGKGANLVFSWDDVLVKLPISW